jgi:hypothetical protein
MKTIEILTERENYRLVPALKAGGLWFVEVETGSRKKGTRRSAAVSAAIYTLAQAQTFCQNNNARDFQLRLQQFGTEKGVTAC